VTVHVPVLVAFNTPVVIEQPAVPTVVTAYVTAPVPPPPAEVNVRPVPKLPFTLVSVSADAAMKLSGVPYALPPLSVTSTLNQ
jgi:hypothetical protein